ncbi:MAG: glycosyltransferase family 4 protein [Calditrichia bacterium]
MHIAYISQHFVAPDGVGGLRPYMWSRKLVEAGHRVTLICGIYESNQAEEQPAAYVTTKTLDGITLKILNEPYSNKQSLMQRAQVFRKFARAAFREILKIKPDLIFASSTPLTVGLPARKAAKKLKVPFVFEVRDLWPQLIFALGAMKNPLARWYLTHMERSIYRAASHIIALSPGIKTGICKTGFPENNVSIIPNCSDVDIFSPRNGKAEHENDGSKVRFVFAGAHGIANGLDAVIDAAAELKKRGYDKAQFLLVGDGSQKKRLVDRSLRENLDGYILWMPPMKKNELAALMREADAGLMILANIPEFYDGTSPNKFFDYLASGLLVLNNYPGWLARIIGEKECGLVAEPENPVDFADKVITLCESREMREKMGKNSRELAESMFSRDALGDDFVRILESVHTDHLKLRR